MFVSKKEVVLGEMLVDKLSYVGSQYGSVISLALGVAFVSPEKKRGEEVRKRIKEKKLGEGVWRERFERA